MMETHRTTRTHTRRGFLRLAGLGTAAIAGSQAAAKTQENARANAVLRITDNQGQVDTGLLALWYRQPAEDWHDGLPIGNGRIGAMVLGGTQRERITLNHTWLWRKLRLRGRTNPKVSHHLPAIRKLFFEGKTAEASRAANSLLGSQKNLKGAMKPGHRFSPDPFVPAGELAITFREHQKVTDYRRQLDLATGVVSVSYRHNGVAYRRQVFASNREGMLVVHLSADKPQSITCTVGLSRPSDKECSLVPWAEAGRIGFDAKFVEEQQFAVAAAVHLKKGSARPVAADDRAEIRIERADEALIVLDVATDHEAKDPKALCLRHIGRIKSAADFKALLRDHVADHRQLFDRVRFWLADSAMSEVPTDSRLALHREGKEDLGLQILLFQYGRYLLMSSSRGGGSPANLQGIWNSLLSPPWASDLHHDINLQMNYWPAEVCNLSECTGPLFDYLDRCVPAGRTAARNLYGCRGIFIPLTNDTWARCLKVEPGWDEWTAAAAWLAQHYWWHWEFSGDEDFLRKRAYPFMKEVALFYEDYLVPDPRKASPHKGRLVTVPSQSPENRFKGGIGPVSLCIGASMDFQVIHDVMTHLLAGSKILKLDADRRAKWEEILKRIPPPQVGRHGQLQEWLADYEETEPQHRHLSHLFALFPGDQITLRGTPRLVKAAKTSLWRRIDAGTKKDPWRHAPPGGWRGAWYISLLARLQCAEEAHQMVVGQLRGTSASLLNGRKLFQIDGNFGYTAGVAEMLLQSQGPSTTSGQVGEVHLLPALPSAWPTGHIKGLRARGGFEVDIAWKEGRLTAATIRSNLGRPCKVRYKKKTVDIKTKAGKSYELDKNLGKG